MARNSLNVLKRSNQHRKFQKFNMTVALVHVNGRKKFRVIRGSELWFVIKHALFPLRTTCLLARCSDLWEVCAKTFVKVANSFTTASWCHFMTSSKVSCISDHFWIFWNLKAMVLTVCVQALTPICLKIPSNLLHRTLTCTQGHKYDFQAMMVCCCMYIWFKFELRQLYGKKLT